MPARSRRPRPELYLPTDAEMLAARQDFEQPLTFDPHVTVQATGLGPWAGKDPVDAITRVRGELGDPHLSYLPELADRGYRATLLARSIAALEGLSADGTAAGWRLTRGYSAEGDYATSLLASDINALADVVGREKGTPTGTLKIRLLGPVSLAVQTYLTNGERALSDHGARRDLAESQLAGLHSLLGLLREAAPGSNLLVQFEEPHLIHAAQGTIKTSSGYRIIRSIPRHELVSLMTQAQAGVHDVGAQPVVSVDYLALHPEIQAVLEAPIVDSQGLPTSAWEPLAAHLEAGRSLYLPTVDIHHKTPAGSLAGSLWSTWRDLGLGKDLLNQLVLTERGNLADTDPARATTVLNHLTETARALSEIGQDS
ncbi:hypothetical protein [Rothia nasimurium]|uniref:hypothetical protein n=1 Tax=Rothia nasimurium TaxID=85336 RepID=UPI001F3584B3|nr:hypothetical protein [Rothia nasimurium]